MWLSFIVLIGYSTGEYFHVNTVFMVHAHAFDLLISVKLSFFYFFLYIYVLALWMVYMTQDPESLPSYRSFPITLFSLFELSVGLIDLPVDHTIFTPPIVHVLHCTFSVVSYLLLLNLLIAMMSDTHWRVAQERDELWRTQVSDVSHRRTRGVYRSGMREPWSHSCCYLLQVVATTLMLERRLPRCLWPQLGVCGLEYGLKERWYLRWDNRERGGKLEARGLQWFIIKLFLKSKFSICLWSS